MHAAGAAQFSSGVPGQMHKYVALHCAVLFLVAIAAPMEQSNNAAMYAEVSQSDLFRLLFQISRKAPHQQLPHVVQDL